MGQENPSVDSIFWAAVEIEATDERAAYVEEACADDPQVRERVQKLLDAHFRAGSFLESPATGVASTAEMPAISEQPGTIIGRYKLMERIGEGGMGVVYVAEQREPVRRKVALKIIKPGMDTEEVIARFEAERQALALMDHPNIARVLDAGATESGRPYFVMELVRGIPITDYCDQNNLTARERLELFLAVCHAVQHAHQKGVIHRDVKPTNVLVTLHDGTPVPKIIDFGVAKAINQQLTERTVYTRHMQMIGTPLYMSPEQAELSGLDVDTRTDIYSLGVLLYELLTGTTPFDKQRFHQAAYDEVRRIIREEEPPKPSTRISTLGATATAISAHRKTDPKRLSQLIRGDLDWIVMKALEKDRTRRYETANGFARDVERHLKDEPIEARAPSALYRLRKFVRRNKVGVTTSALVAAVLILGVTGTMWERYRGTVNQLNIELIGCIQRRELPEAEKILEKLVERGHGGNPATLRAQGQLALAYADPQVDRLQDAVPLMQKTLQIQRLVLGEEEADTIRSAASLESLGESCLERAYNLSAPPDAPRADCDRAVQVARLAIELDPDRSPFNPWDIIAVAEYRSGDLEASLRAATKSLERDEPWPQAPSWFLLAMVHQRQRHEALARDWFTAACEWSSTAGNWTFPTLPEEAASRLGLRMHDAPVDYVEFYSKMIERHPRIGVLFYRRGSHYARRGRWKDAARDYARAVELQPRMHRVWEAWGAVCLEVPDKRGYETACREMLAMVTRLGHYKTQTLIRLDPVVLCCLGPAKTVDYGELDRIATVALSETTHTYVRLAKGMVAYRCGRFNESIGVMPESGYDCTKNALLAQFFRAMAYEKLSKSTQARLLLENARRQFERDLPGPGGPATMGYDQPVLFCLVRAALREAEALIEPAGQRSESAGEEVRKEHPKAAPSSTR